MGGQKRKEVAPPSDDFDDQDVLDEDVSASDDEGLVFSGDDRSSEEGVSDDEDMTEAAGLPVASIPDRTTAFQPEEGMTSDAAVLALEVSFSAS